MAFIILHRRIGMNFYECFVNVKSINCMTRQTSITLLSLANQDEVLSVSETIQEILELINSI